MGGRRTPREGFEPQVAPLLDAGPLESYRKVNSTVQSRFRMLVVTSLLEQLAPPDDLAEWFQRGT